MRVWFKCINLETRKENLFVAHVTKDSDGTLLTNGFWVDQYYTIVPMYDYAD